MNESCYYNFKINKAHYLDHVYFHINSIFDRLYSGKTNQVEPNRQKSLQSLVETSQKRYRTSDKSG